MAHVDTNVRAVIIKGQGANFSVGWEIPKQDQPLTTAAQAIADLRKPVIAAINGDCVGHGLELALACDFRISVPEARLGLPQIKHGLLPWDGGTQRLPRIIGRPNAFRLLLTGQLITAKEALHMGLVNLVTDHNGLDHSVNELVRSLVSGGPVAIAYAKEAVISGLDLTLDQGLRLEADLNILLHKTTDRTIGLESFHLRRIPQFEGQ
jgi:enoyl-CoA hydratase/carnithine racemase